MSTWLRFEKIFRGGKKETILYDPGNLDDDGKRALAEDWGENSSGGHNYGYTLYWENGDPTEEEIDRAIESQQKSIERHRGWIELAKERIRCLEDEKRTRNLQPE
jgi:hypothetical protein